MKTSAAQFLMIGERTNITGSPKFAKAIKGGDWDAAVAIARRARCCPRVRRCVCW